MAVYTFNVTHAEVAATLGITIDASSQPTDAQTTIFISDRSAELAVWLEGGPGISATSGITAVTDENLYNNCRRLIKSVVMADWLMSNQGEENDRIIRLYAGWDKFEEQIREMPEHVLSKQAASNTIRQSFSDGYNRTAWPKSTSFR
jgi:hypothetical protein